MQRTLLVLILLAAGCAGRGGEQRFSGSNGAVRPGNLQVHITVDGMEREYILHVPPAAGSRDALPLMVVLHGTYGTGRKMQLGLGFDRYADERGFYVAYPTAYRESGSVLPTRWNDGRETIESSLKSIDDVKFIATMVDDIAARVPIDRARVYVTGASNGGMMAFRLGCETPGIFAGIAPVIGNLPMSIAETCTPRAPLEILTINGDADPFIPLQGGEVCANVRLGCEGGQVLSTRASLDKFAEANECMRVPETQVLPVQVDDGTSIETLTFSACKSGARVISYIVHGGGHTWSPRMPQIPSAGKTSMNLDATQVIVDFFIQR